jgi:hypothetical protein
MMTIRRASGILVIGDGEVCYIPLNIGGGTGGEMVRRVTVSIALVLTGLVGMAMSAYAGNWSDSEFTTGAAASCTMRSWTAQIHDQNADISCDISDTLGDSHSVYVEWWQDGYANKKRLTNHDGVGHNS